MGWGNAVAPRTSEETQVTDAAPVKAGPALPRHCVNAPLIRTIFPQEAVQRNRPDAQVRLEGRDKNARHCTFRALLGTLDVDPVPTYRERRLQPVGGAVISSESQFSNLLPLTDLLDLQTQSVKVHGCVLIKCT